jgi:hypothetical protein
MSDRDFFWFMAVLVLFGIGIGAALFVGVPWLWDLLKPLLHAWSA